MLLKFGAAVLALCLWLAEPASSAEPAPIDPIFGLSYALNKVRFEPAPPDILERCPELANAKWNRQLFVYARAGAEDDFLLVLGGYFIERTSATRAQPAPQPDPQGVVAHLVGRQCILVGPAREVFLFSQDELGVARLKALAQDAVHRYDAAFGAPAAFRAALRQQGVKLDHPRAGILRDALQMPAR